MKRKNITWLIVVAILIAGGAWYGIHHARETRLETTDVKIANLPIIQGLPLYLALEKGYFKDAGLNIQVVTFQAPNQLIDALLSGQVDFTSPSGANGITAVADFKNPGKMKIYALAGGDSTIQNDAIMVKTGSTIKNLEELKGKKLGILPGIQWRTIAQSILVQKGLVADQDVTLVELAGGLQGQALATGQVDALLGVEPTPTIVKVKGIGTELVPKATIEFVADPFYGGAGAVQTEFAQQNPRTTAKVLAVFDRAIREINENPDAARQYLKGNTPLDDGSIAQVPISRLRMYTSLTQSDTDAIQKFYNIFTASKVVDGKMDFKNLLYSPATN